MKTIHNYNRADAINVLVKDNERDLSVEVLEEDGAIVVTVTHKDETIGAGIVDLPAELTETEDEQ